MSKVACGLYNSIEDEQYRQAHGESINVNAFLGSCLQLFVQATPITLSTARVITAATARGSTRLSATVTRILTSFELYMHSSVIVNVLDEIEIFKATYGSCVER